MLHRNTITSFFFFPKIINETFHPKLLLSFVSESSDNKKSRQLKNLHERLLLGGENYMNFERTVNLNVTFYNKPSNISTIMHHRTSQAGLEASAGRENDRPRDH